MLGAVPLTMCWKLHRRRLAQALGACLALSTLAACSNPAVQLLTRQRLSLSREQLQAALAQRFPLEQRVAEVLDLRLAEPVLQLQAGRIGAELALTVTERLLGTAHPARMALDFGLRFEPSDRSVRMQGVRVQQLAFTRLAPAYQALMNRHAPALAERALEGQVLYQVSEADWQSLLRLGLVPGEFTVTPQGLDLDFRPPPPTAAGSR